MGVLEVYEHGILCNTSIMHVEHNVVNSIAVVVPKNSIWDKFGTVGALKLRISAGGKIIALTLG